MFDNILACYDLSEPSKSTLEYSLKIAWKSNANLKIAHIIVPRDRPLGQDTAKQSAEFLKRLREKIDEEVRVGSVVGKEVRLKSLEVQVLEGHPVISLLKEIERESPDLVIIGTHGRSGIFQFLLGSVAEKIVRHSPAPVLTVRRAAVWPPKTLLLPVDFSESTEEALLFASQISQIAPVQVELLHVLPPLQTMVALGEGAGYPMPIDRNLMEKEAVDQLAKIIASHPSLKMTSQVVEGSAAQGICERAKKINADMILIPTHGRSNIGRLLMGSVAEQVVRYAPCSVLSFCPKKTIGLRKQIVSEL